MADYFVDVEIESDEQTLADDAVARLQDAWPDWEPNEGDLEVVLIEALAQMASDAAETAAVMPAMAFQTILEELFGVARDEGTPATGTVTFTLIDTVLRTIDAGTEVSVDGWAFLTDDDVVTSGTTTVAGVPVTSELIDTAANGLTGDQVAMITATAFIVDVSLDAPTAGATDPESDEAYLDKGSRVLELQAITLVTGRDYELMGLTSEGVERISAVANQSSRTITVTASKADGTPLTAGTGSEKEALLALYNTYRQTTWTVSLADPTRTTINVSYSVHLFPGYEPAGVISEVNEILAALLDPARWNTPSYDRQPTSTWVVEPYVRKNKVIDAIGNAHGVDYVVSVTLAGSAGTLQGNGDWLMPGTVPLPLLGTITSAVA